MNIIQKALVIVLIAIIILNSGINTIYAAIEIPLKKAYIEKIGEAEYHLKYYREDRDIYTYLICSVVGYKEDGNFNPTYCMNKNLKGAEDESYYVTVDSLLDNNAVWRVIKNGYPYKSAKQLGLSSEYNAYAVTKWAIYCILGESKLEYFKAEKDDKEAAAMLKALKQLVDIGKNGTEKQDEKPLSIQKVGELVENEISYIQEYKVKSTAEFEEYKVEDKKLEEGVYITNVEGEEQEIFKAEESFKVIVPKESINGEINIELEVSAECKSYIILEGKTTVTKTQNYVVTAGELSKATEKVDLKIEHKEGNLKILKVDKDNKNLPIEGVEFELYSKDENKIIGTYKTDKKGEIYIENLKEGEYKIIEKSVNKWYNLSKEIDAEIKWNETTEKVIENELKKSKIKINKVDKDNNEIKIEGAKFEVLDEQKNVLETVTTNKNGEAETKAYPVKEYQKLYLKEIETNDKYVLNESLIEVSLELDKDTEITIKNRKIKGKIKIIKTTSEKSAITGVNAGESLEGVVFEIYDSDNNFIQKITTDKEGIAITQKLEKGKYKIKEVSTNKWYYLDNEIKECEIKENGEIVELEIKNDPKNPGINIEKSGQEKAEPGEKIEYDISFQNTGNTKLDKFTMLDTIPSKYIKVTNFKTGTYNQKVKYNVYYKTNLSNGEYILLMEELDSLENYEIDFQRELADNEVVIEIKLEFGTVDIGFSSNENPNITAIVKEKIKSETTFTNIAKISGKCETHKVSDISRWKTFVYKILPKTGF